MSLPVLSKLKYVALSLKEGRGHEGSIAGIKLSACRANWLWLQAKCLDSMLES